MRPCQANPGLTSARQPGTSEDWDTGIWDISFFSSKRIVSDRFSVSLAPLQSLKKLGYRDNFNPPVRSNLKKVLIAAHDNVRLSINSEF